MAPRFGSRDVATVLEGVEERGSKLPGQTKNPAVIFEYSAATGATSSAVVDRVKKLLRNCRRRCYIGERRNTDPPHTTIRASVPTSSLS